MLREYKSVVFWLIFVSLWIVGSFPCCNEKKENEDKTKKDKSISKNNKASNFNNYNKYNTNSSNNIKYSFNNQQTIPSMINSKENNIESDFYNNYNISYNANNNINNNKSLQKQLMQQNVEKDKNFDHFKNIDNPFTFQNNNMSDGNNFMQNQGFSINQNPEKISEQQQINSQNPDNQFNEQPFLANMGIQNGNNMHPFLKQNNNIAMMNNYSMSNNQVSPINQTQNNRAMMYDDPIQNINLRFHQNNIASPPTAPKEEPISTYNQPTLIGLDNIGATCFMNATLQCLSQTEPLSNYFLKEKNKNRIINNNYKLKDPNQLQLSPYYLELIENLWDKKDKISYPPNNFRKIVEQMNPLFKEGQPGDSKDFIVFIIDQMHRELKDIKEIDEPKPNLNQYDKENAFNYFNNDFKNDCSVISETFYGLLENTNICQNCKITFNKQGLNSPICYNYQTFNCLIFPLEEVRKKKNISVDNQNQNQIQNNRVNLYDCFTYYQKDELLTGDNQIYCNICNQSNDSINSSKIYRGPNFLILILNRGRGNIYDVKLDFTETIDITQFILQKDKPQIIYNLYGVITHLGQSGPNAHFVASCKSPVDNKWYRYNDPFVNPINDVQKDIIDYGTPYILFYHK